ncbi:Allantoicase [Coemansia sp. RSA 989]|nr:ureidoglycolate hydrolase [Coemansia mojavensis]KAJ1742231.1 Allantoicase [Coemansia sp. RSA 1086]KAJ1750578.1 Allantoicase [Coemansia sp. RSA 1821]KAJ1865168.1 Allantoicase [Coemansia sp. RSA 989]KAJ1872497.1 Allantoicase [Coemansia sp. RSA 990]KAJ2629696.1 Allantoicase [Coemansia sp. RSA 1290]KAJ2653521.1 Allantoicase [Coemansia sp. RSA 1250]KAJ2677236.1 Allantoicase [Coemansia sp. RSA 1085]
MTRFQITIEPLTIDSFKPYGDVIQLEGNKNVVIANQGTAKRVNHVAKLENLRECSGPALQSGRPNMCIFSSAPRPTIGGRFEVKLLERHPYSSQVFMPIHQQGTAVDPDKPCYLVIVAENGPDDKPDLRTIRAFAANSTQGINYKANSWHSPMVTIGTRVNFIVLVWENGVALQDCEEAPISPVLVDLTPSFKNLPESKL